MPTIVLDIEPAAYYSLDLFPASVNAGGPDGPLLGEEFRVIVTDNYFYVFQEVAGLPEILIKEPLTLFEGTNKTGYTVTTTMNVYYVRRAANCGCGNRLRGITIFSGVPHQSYLPKPK